ALLPPITIVPLLIRPPVRLTIPPLSTDKVDPEVMVTPSRRQLIPWISAPLGLVRLPPMICVLLRSTNDEPSVEMVPLVLVTTDPEKYSVPSPVASSVPVFVKRAPWFSM